MNVCWRTCKAVCCYCNVIVLPIKATGTWGGGNYFLQNFGKDLCDDVTHTRVRGRASACAHTQTHIHIHAHTHTHTHTHTHKLQALIYNILPSTTAVFSYAIGPRKLSANECFFGGAQTEVSLLQTTEIKQGVSFTATNKVYTSTNKTTIVWIETELFFFNYPCLGARLFPQSYQYPNLLEGTDHVGGQLHGDKEGPFSSVTKSGRVWRKVPVSDARSVGEVQ